MKFLLYSHNQSSSRNRSVLLTVSIDMKRHQDQGNVSKGNYLFRCYLTVSEVQSIIIIIGWEQGGMQAGTMLEELLLVDM